MKVILLRDVAKIGRKFEVVSVPDGYALNNLIPKKDAEAATPANLKRIAARQARTAGEQSDLEKTARNIAEQLTKSPLTITVKANEQNHLFQALSVQEVLTTANQAGVTIPKEMIKLEAIKTLGDHEITITAGSFSALVKITVAKI